MRIGEITGMSAAAGSGSHLQVAVSLGTTPVCSKRSARTARLRRVVVGVATLAAGQMMHVPKAPPRP